MLYYSGEFKSHERASMQSVHLCKLRWPDMPLSGDTFCPEFLNCQKNPGFGSVRCTDRSLYDIEVPLPTLYSPNFPVLHTNFWSFFSRSKVWKTSAETGGVSWHFNFQLTEAPEMLLSHGTSHVSQCWTEWTKTQLLLIFSCSVRECLVFSAQCTTAPQRVDLNV